MQGHGFNRLARSRSEESFCSFATACQDKQDMMSKYSSTSLKSNSTIPSQLMLSEESLQKEQVRFKSALLAGLSLLAGAGIHQMPSTYMSPKLKLKENGDVKFSFRQTIGKNSGARKLKLTLYHVDLFRKIWRSDDYFDMLASFSDEFEQTPAANSGSLMFWSRDRKYIAKTLSPVEVSSGRFVFPALCKYLETQPKSHLVKFAAVMKIRWSTNKVTYVSIMPNVFYGVQIKKQRQYDLKGSSYGRQAKTPSDMRKDLDFIADGLKLSFDSWREKEAWLSQLTRDVSFLQSQGRIDYSLLVAFGQGQWYASIIDILTPFSKRKLFENKILGTFRKGISCVPPLEYALRFGSFISRSCLSIDRI